LRGNDAGVLKFFWLFLRRNYDFQHSPPPAFPKINQNGKGNSSKIKVKILSINDTIYGFAALNGKMTFGLCYGSSSIF